MLQAIVLALIQGIGVFLPVSALVHRRVVSVFLGWEAPGPAVEAGLELGALVAVALYYGFDWLQMAAHSVGLEVGRDPELHRARGLFPVLLAASLPIALTGYWLGTTEAAFADPFLAGLLLISVGLMLGWAERGDRWQKSIDHLSFADAMLVGVVQSLAVLPGASRMALTLIAALLLNFDRASALRLSYLLALPVLAGRTWFALQRLAVEGDLAGGAGTFAAAALVCAVAGVATMALFTEYAQHASLRPVVRYRVGFGIMVIALAVLLR